MKSSLRIAVLALTLLGATAPGLAWSAGNPLYEHALKLQNQQQSQQFSIGDTVYQFIPDAVLVPDEPATSDANTPSTRSASSSTPAAAHIGPYAIVLPGQGGAVPKTRSAATRGSAGYEVAVNMKTGLPVLMLPQLQLQVREAGHGEALAQALGGQLLFDGSASLMVVVGFDSVAAALQALPQARAMDNVTNAQPALQRRFRKPH